MIKASSLTKHFGDLTAVNNVSLQVNKGDIFGLLGPNAAGKTTIIRMLCGIIPHDAGDILIHQQPVEQAKHNFGYVAQYFGQYEELTVWENLQFYARMYGVTDTDWLHTLIDRYELTHFKDRFSGQLSGGYQRRLALVCAMAHNPDVIFLDEPTAGIDPVTRKLLWDDFYRLSAEGKTLFVTTHYMEEAQRCHQLAFLSSGNIVAQGTPDTIKEALGDARVYAAKIPYSPELRSRLQAMDKVILVNRFGDELRVVVQPSIDKSTLDNLVSSIGAGENLFSETESNLEDVFISLTQKSKVSV